MTSEKEISSLENLVIFKQDTNVGHVLIQPDYNLWVGLEGGEHFKTVNKTSSVAAQCPEAQLQTLTDSIALKFGLSQSCNKRNPCFACSIPQCMFASVCI